MGGGLEVERAQRFLVVAVCIAALATARAEVHRRIHELVLVGKARINK